MTTTLQRLTVVQKISVLLVLSFFGCSAIAAVALYQVHSNLMDDRQSLVRSIIETSDSLVQQSIDRQNSGVLSPEQAQAEAFAALRAIRYGTDGYIFVIDQNATILMHPIKPNLEGTSTIDGQDASGRYYFRDMIRAANSTPEGSMTTYDWPRTVGAPPVEKMSFVRSVPEWGWILGTGVYIDDVWTSFLQMVVWMGVVGGLLTSLIIGVGLLVGRDLAKPIQALTRDMSTLKSGKLDLTVSGTQRSDEIGRMARAVEVFQTGLIENKELAAAKEAEQAEKELRGKRMAEAIAAFEMTILRVLDGLGHADQTMNTMSGLLVRTSSTTIEAAGHASEDAENASHSTETMAGAAEELSASIQAISATVTQSKDVVSIATERAHASAEQIGQLEQAVARITEITDLISSIAAQTNLLALNATIEAARAGDAGKGFAVVAGEVKALANQTAKATEDITNQISEVRETTGASVKAMGEMSEIISEVQDLSTSIASAITQQTAATSQIAESVDNAARGTHAVSDAVGTVLSMAEEVGGAADQIQDASQALTAQAKDLKAKVAEFLQTVKADSNTDDTEEESIPPLITWDDQLTLGIEGVDQDHLHTVELINTLHAQLKRGTGNQIPISRTLSELDSFVTQHFKTEEGVMESLRYPGLQAHRIDHQAFLDRIKAMKEAVSQDNTMALMDIVALLGSWWGTHMQQHDRALAMYCARQADSPSFDAAA